MKDQDPRWFSDVIQSSDSFHPADVPKESKVGTTVHHVNTQMGNISNSSVIFCQLEISFVIDNECQYILYCMSQVLETTCIHKAAARVQEKTKERDDTTPVLASLHWPLLNELQYELLSTSSQAQSCLMKLIVPYYVNKEQRFLNAGFLVLPRGLQSRTGTRASSFQAPLHTFSPTLTPFKSNIWTCLGVVNRDMDTTQCAGSVVCCGNTRNMRAQLTRQHPETT